MNNFLIRLILSALAVFICATILPGAQVDGFLIAIVVAAVLAILNVFDQANTGHIDHTHYLSHPGIVSPCHQHHFNSNGRLVGSRI
jgi:hypothetical protein